MAQSPEYPDLRWVVPKSWTNANRTSVQLIVIHTTEGHEVASSAEDGAAYDARRTDGTSTHYFHDQNSTVQCVRTEDQAHAARTQGNRRGIQHELCGKAGQGASGWADDASQGTLRRAAKQAARDAKKWNIPVRHLTVAQVKAGEKGFCGHGDVTRAFPQDNGTHTDPGDAFPWTQFLNLVRAELDPKTLEDDMADAFTLGKQPDGTPTSPAGHVMWSQGIPNGLKKGSPRDDAWEVIRDLGVTLANIDLKLSEQAKQITDLQAKVAALTPPAKP